MPRLPDSSNMGVRSAASGRPIASIDTTAIGAGVASLGRSIGAVAGDVAAVDRKESAERNSLEDASARSYLLTEKVKADEKRDNIDDPAELEKHKPVYHNILESASGLIKDPARREKFILENRPMVENAGVAVNNRAFNIKKDKFLAESQTELDGLREAGLKSQDEGERTKIIDAGRAKIDALKDNGYISEVQAVSMKKKWIENYAVSKLEMMPPEERMAALRGDIKPTQAAKGAFDFFVSKGWTPVQAAGIIGNLMQESSMNSRARNAGDGSDGSDSIGVGQWNSDRAARLKKFASARGTDWHDLQTQLEFVDLELRTSEGKAGQMLTNAKDVRAATAAMVMYERPRGSNRGAEYADGWGNRLRHAQTFASSYAGGPAPERPKGVDVASVLPSDTRQQMFNQARDQYRFELNKRDYEFRQEVQSVKNLIADDISSIRMTGKPVADLTPERVEATQGREAAQQWEQGRQMAQSYYTTTKDFPTMTNQQINESVEKLKPEGGGQGFSEKEGLYQEVKKQATKIVRAREDDPADYADSQPQVRTVKEQAQYTGTGPEKRITPNSAQSIVRARMTAQEAVGVEVPKPITNKEAEIIADRLRAIGDDDTKALTFFMQSIEQTYGSYAPMVLAAALEMRGVRRDLANAATTVLTSLFTKSAKDQNAWNTIEANRRWPDAASTPAGSALAAMAPEPAMAPTYEGFLPQTQAAPGEAKKPGSTYDARDLRWLWENRANQNAQTDFDLRYGGGASATVLKDLERRMTGKKAANGK